MTEEDHIEKKKSPLWGVVGVFLILIIIMSYLPATGYSKDKEPTAIPSLAEVRAFDNVKDMATFIASYGCDSGDLSCQIKAQYYFVRDEIDYVKDPVGEEYIESPLVVVNTGGADCESGSILLSSLLGSIGVYSELYVIPSHALIRYSSDHGFVYLDWTCSNCAYGELSGYDLMYIK